MNLAAQQCLYGLVEEIGRYLAGLEPGCFQFAQCREGLAALQLSPAHCRPLPSAADPPCGHLDEALELAREHGSPALVNAIERSRKYLTWTTYDVYAAHAIGRRFAGGHAFAELVGPGMPFAAPDYCLGLFLMAPHTFYRDHRHRAPELYAPLTGPTLWRFDRGRWSPGAAHQPIWNEPWRIHATIVEEAPFLCIYVWTRDVREPAEVVTAPDWEEIEQRL